MQSIKKTLLVLFALCCILTAIIALSVTSSASVTTKAFSDVVENAWYTESVYSAFDHGYMQGTSDGLFSPETPLTRGMAVTILANMSKAEISSYANVQSFTDVAKDKWYHNAVEWAKANGIVNGTSATTFAPKNNITTQDACVMLYNYATFCKFSTSARGDLNKYTDGSQTSSYAQTATQWAIGNNMIGNGTTKINPKGNASRALIAYIIYHFDQSVGHKWGSPVVQTERTCTTDGVVEWHCADCDRIDTVTLKAWHVWISIKNDVNNGKRRVQCVQCKQAKYVECYPHAFVNGICTLCNRNELVGTWVWNAKINTNAGYITFVRTLVIRADGTYTETETNYKIVSGTSTITMADSSNTSTWSLEYVQKEGAYGLAVGSRKYVYCLLKSGTLSLYNMGIVGTFYRTSF